MENLIELALVAAAAYGVKSYFFSAEAEQNRELFASRAAVLAKRMVRDRGETAAVASTSSEKAAQADEQILFDAAASPADGAPQSAEAVAVEKEKAALASRPADAAAVAVPEDSVLNRHFRSGLVAQQRAISDPYPTDSVLNRHYRQRQTALLAMADSDAPVPPRPAAAVAVEVTETAVTTEARYTLPEDSVLKRHALSQIQHQVESQTAPCPSDAVLRRHYRQLIQAKVEAYLAEPA